MAERRAAITGALNKAIEIFTSHSEKTFTDVINSGLRPIMDAVGLDRVVLYRKVNIDGDIRFGQMYRWDRTEGGLVSLDEDLRILPDIVVIERWIAALSKGESVRIRKSDMSADELAFLGAFGVKSLLMVPIFSRGEFWGSVALQDHTNDRYFDEGCADLLYSAARLCSDAVIRAEISKNADEAIGAFKRREKMVNVLNKMSVTFLSQSRESFDTMMTEGIGLIADMMDIDRISVWRNSSKPDGMYASQIYRWERKSGGTTTPNAELADLAYYQVVPSWENILKNGGTVNGPIWMQPEYEAAAMKKFGIVSIFVTPVFISNALWGMMIFEDHRNERCFEDDYAEIMRSAAFLCVNTVIRADMEHKITDADEFSTAVKEASPLSYVLFNEDLQAIDCNDVMLRTLACPDKQHFLDHYWELFLPESQPDGYESLEKAIAKRNEAFVDNKVTFEWVHRSLNGELIPMENTLTQVPHRGKRLIISFKYDLRNTKKMMDNIHEQSEMLKIRLEQQELISEISRGFIASGDSETYVKEAIAKLGRYHKVSMVVIFGIDYQRDETYMAYQWSADGNPPQLVKFGLLGMIRATFPDRLPDCSTVPVISYADVAASEEKAVHALLSVNVNAFICAPLYVEGRLWGIISVEQRFTPRQWTENEKSFVAMTASTIAGVIMRDIYNTKLQDALHKATEASRAKGEFLSNMSHEMRTPLNAIIGMTTIGKKAATIERKDYALDKIDGASTHLLGVINDVLDMSKIEANMLELSPVEFNFEKMLQKVIAVVNFRVDERRQKLKIHIDRDIPKTLIGDDQRLAQVITNLLGNAVKFTGEGGSITLDTRFVGEEDDLCTIQISVTDTGIGISTEQQTRLFSSFQQAESSTTRKFGGTGLGLAISKNIVEMMGGRIWIESELGKGATFAFIIQAKQGSQKKQGLLAADVNLSNVRIMAVDDDPDILDYLKEIAQGFGVFCETAISGEAALRLVEQNEPYHIYFVDWKMPGMDGIQLAAELKKRTSAKSIVIMISAAEWTTIEEKAKKAGVDKFLSKPVFPSAIADAINEALGVDYQRIEEAQTDIAGLFAGWCILLVEDIEINREIVLALLEPTQLEIDCAENGVEAVRMFSEAPQKYDMIFMDVQMPEMDGYEATRRIRELEVPEAKTVPIVAMTANVFREDIEECIRIGMNSHVGKPLEFDEVLDRLHTYLR